jgi:hypothetical protein
MKPLLIITQASIDHMIALCGRRESLRQAVFNVRIKSNSILHLCVCALVFLIIQLYYCKQNICCF